MFNIHVTLLCDLTLFSFVMGTKLQDCNFNITVMRISCIISARYQFWGSSEQIQRSAEQNYVKTFRVLLSIIRLLIPLRPAFICKQRFTQIIVMSVDACSHIHLHAWFQRPFKAKKSLCVPQALSSKIVLCDYNAFMCFTYISEKRVCFLVQCKVIVVDNRDGMFTARCERNT